MLQHRLCKPARRFSCQWPSFKDLKMLPSHSIVTPSPVDRAPDFVQLHPRFSVSEQLHPHHLMEAIAAGFTMIVNNRPDSEVRALGSQQLQPTSDVMQRAAHSLGLRYKYLPITPGAAAAVAPELSGVLAEHQKVKFCERNRVDTPSLHCDSGQMHYPPSYRPNLALC